MKVLVAVDISESTETISGQGGENNQADSAEVWILCNALPEPDQLEFKMDPLKAREELAKPIPCRASLELRYYRPIARVRLGHYGRSCARHTGRSNL